MIDRKLLDAAKLHGEKILRHKLNNRRIAVLCSVSIEDAPTIRSLARGLDSGQTVAEEDIVDTQTPYDEESPYYFNEHTDTYVFTLSGIPTPVVLSGQMVRDLVTAYSNYDGSPATLNECARTFKLPRTTIKKILASMGMTHDSLPFTKEYVEKASDDRISEDAFQMRQGALMRRLEREKWKEVQRNADKWANFEHHTLRAIVAAIQDRTPVPEVSPTLELPDADEPYIAVIGLSDLHYGKYSDPKENGVAGNRAITEQDLTECTLDLIAKISKMGRPELIVVPIGSDFFHIDNRMGGTTKGTPQDTDGTYAEIIEGGISLMEDHIEMLRQLGPVQCILMSGNHDRDSGLALLWALEGIYRNVDDVHIRKSYHPREYLEWGNNLIGFAHGDGVKKTQELAGMMAKEQPGSWARCRHKNLYTGNYHFEKTTVDTSLGVVRRQLPSLSGTDRWHTLNGYIDSEKALPAYLHGRDTGLMSIMYAYPDNP